MFDNNGFPDNAQFSELVSMLDANVADFFSGNPKLSVAEILAVANYLGSRINKAAEVALISNEKIRKQKYADLNLDDAEIEKMRTGKIQAIKMYRERTGLGLREAKDAVESWAKENQRGKND